MGVVAVHAVVLRGSVFPEEGPPLVGMTLMACLIDCVFLQQRFSGRSVRLMAVGATEESIFDGMGGDLEHLGATFFMALKTDARLGFWDENRVTCCVSLVAARASLLGAVVGAALPVNAGATLVATQALLVLRTRRVFLAEDDGNQPFDPRFFVVLGGVAVAGFAFFASAFWCPGVALHEVFAVGNREVSFVALDALFEFTLRLR